MIAFRIALVLGAPFGGVHNGRRVITPSAGERRLWVPVSIVLLALSLVVALTAR